MGAGGEGVGEGVLARLRLDQAGERSPILDAFLLQMVGQRNALAILVERHQYGHVLLRPADTQVGAISQAVKHVCSVERPTERLVAHRRPRGLLAGDEMDAVLAVEAFCGGNDHAGAVCQGNETDLHIDLLGRIGSGRPGALAYARGHQFHQGGGNGLPFCLVHEILPALFLRLEFSAGFGPACLACRASI
jgi:hypothetical protein